MRYEIHGDGSFDITGDYIGLRGAYPSCDGLPVHPLAVQAAENAVRYQLERGTVTLRFYEDGGKVSITCTAEGLPGLHDLEPLGNARISGADHVFVQGFGMEGPSGLYPLSGDVPPSHGLTALCQSRQDGRSRRAAPEQDRQNGFAAPEQDRTGREAVLLAYAEDHRRYSLRFHAAQGRGLFQDAPLFSGGYNLEGTAGTSMELPPLYLEEGEGLEASLRHCAGRIASFMGARHRQPPAFFWCSWYYLYETLDQSALEEYLEGMKHTDGADFQYIELDAGYAPSLGDWLETNHRYPGGLEQAARAIRAAGYGAGVWIGPFMVGDQSRLVREHPDWILRDLDGNPVVQLRSYTEPKVWGNRDGNYYVLDASHPDALRYLSDVFHTLRRWGFTFFKTDFLLWNMRDSSTVRRYNPALTSVEILRNTFSTIREAVGEDSYLLGCIAPFMPMIGFVDGMRLAGDMGAQWAEPYGPVNLLRELRCDNYFQHQFWQNDPDSIILRDFDTLLSPRETRSLALLQAVSGGVVSVSDPVHRMGEDRKALLRFLRPGGPVTPETPYLGADRRDILLLHRLKQGNLLFALNPTDTPLTVVYRLDQLFGQGDWVQYRYVFDGDGCDRDGFGRDGLGVRDNLFAGTLEPHESLLLFVTEKPLSKKPENLWNW